ncbi:hypothetical protein DFH27DRAFT_582522 [Peziza echinospora]|nr:hypothetical protein DFH27DRAFT_582522 [Peziza echinospora]
MRNCRWVRVWVFSFFFSSAFPLSFLSPPFFTLPFSRSVSRQSIPTERSLDGIEEICRQKKLTRDEFERGA